MHNLEKNVTEEYLRQDEKELLELIIYHRKQYEKIKNRRGGLHPDDIRVMKILDQGDQLIKDILEQRIANITIKQTPILTICPECDIEKERKPIAEEKSEHGYMCNIYSCDECKIEYLDGIPNNAKDQLASMEEIIALFEKHKDILLKDPEQVENIAQFKKQHEKFKQACVEEEKAIKNLQQAELDRDQSIDHFRNYLLLAKINQQWGNPPTGIN